MRMKKRNCDPAALSTRLLFCKSFFYMTKPEKQPLISRVEQRNRENEISASEQARIIQESGILEKIPREQPPYFHQAISMTIGLLLIFGILQLAFYYQFREIVEVSWENDAFVELVTRTAKISLPLLLIVYVTHRFAAMRWMQMLLFVASIGVGIKSLDLMSADSTYGEMKKSTGLAMLWAYTLIQLELTPAFVALLIALAYPFARKFFTANLAIDTSW